MTKVVIDRFIDEFQFLSNFYTSTIKVNGKTYMSVEHAHQAHKTLEPGMHETVRTAKTAALAKRLGQAVPVRPDWESVKVDLMREFVRKKFESPFLAALLLATNDAELINVNFWNDTHFGICRGKGSNLLGKILMEVRDELRQAARETPPDP